MVAIWGLDGLGGAGNGLKKRGIFGTGFSRMKTLKTLIPWVEYVLCQSPLVERGKVFLTFFVFFYSNFPGYQMLRGFWPKRWWLI